MRIYECCPFNNENLIAKIKIQESSKWIDQLHLTESNKTFKYGDKEYCFNVDCDPGFVFYHQINGLKLFKESVLEKSRVFPFVKRMNGAWYNDKVQRDLACSFIHPSDDDIVILSDVDEIIDSRYSDKIISEVKKRGIITIPIRFSLFYLNLFAKNWSGPANYSYRIFIMTGYHFNKLKYKSDKLRKQGESGYLIDKVYCFPEFAGFHHSWLGDKWFVKNKIESYAHDNADHDPRLFNNGVVNMNFVEKCLKNGVSIFGDGYELEINNDVATLESIAELGVDKIDSLFIK